MQRIHTIGVGLLAAALLTSAAPADQADPAAAQGQAQGQAQAMSDDTSSNVDRAFAAVAISHFRLQRQLSKLVADKAVDPQVKQLAQDTYAVSEKLSQRIQKAAEKEGIQIEPDRILPRDQAVLDYMQQLPVAALERNYVFHLAGTNETQRLTCQWVANNAQNPDVKQAAGEIAAKLEQRGKTIQQLAQAELNTNAAQPAAGQVPPGGDK